MRLFIAEKPSLARAIADALPAPQQRRDGYIECGGGNLVAWCKGHILEQAPPDEYDAQFKTWALEHLPIAPSRWKLVVKSPDLLKTIKALLPKATRVVNAGDPDREGQLLVDEVLDFLSYRGPVDRVLISDLNVPAVRKALDEIQPNEKFRNLSESALARSRADWLYGMNMTRLYTLLGRGGGYDGVLSVGRVQTPLLGLVVRRDLEIENFQPKPFYVLSATIATATGATFSASWQPGPSAEAFLDSDGRLVSKEKALELQRLTSGKAGTVTKCSRERKAEAAPLPYSLADLQVDAAKRLGLSAKDVLEVVQSLYETHRMTTYPRSDCSYLPEGHLEQARTVSAAIAANLPGLRELASRADLSLRSRAWNDKKVTAHHAIIPTPNARPDAHLSDRERAVYELIARRYLAQFFPAFEYNQTQIEVNVAGERFTASGRQPLAQGWRVIFSEAAADEDDEKESTAETRALPMLKDGETVSAKEVVVGDKKTQPPKRFTHATLLQAMIGIARFVDNPKIKQILRETDGLGTPATQAAIIEMLFERQYIEEKKKQIISTATGRALIQTLPSVATTPDMTALWESAMRRISEGGMPLDEFLGKVLAQLRELITRGKATGALKVPGAHRCTRPGCTGFLRRRKSDKGTFWSCTTYPACKQTAQDANGKPGAAGGGGGGKRRRPARTEGRAAK